MRIQHNIMAMNAYRNYSSNNSALSKNLEKLSSGYKINRAGDDAAGLAISEKMRAQISGLEQASDNAKSGINLVGTAEGSLTEVHDMLNRMVTLADESANGTYDNDTDRGNLQKEVSQLKSEINRIADSSNFNGIKLLDGSLGTGTTGATASVAAQTAADSTAGISAFNYTLSGTDAGVSVAWTSTDSASPALGSLSASWSGNTLTFSIGLGSGYTGATATLTQADVDAAIKNASGAPDSASGIKVTLDKSFTVKQSTGTAAATLTAMTGATAAEASQATAIGQAVTNTDGASTKVTVTATEAGANNHTLTVSNNTAGVAEGATAIADGNVSLNLDATTTYTSSDINQMLSKAGADMTVSFDGSLTGATLLNADANGDHVFTLGTDGTAGGGLSSGGGLTLQIGDTADSFNQLTVSVDDMHADALGIGDIDISTQSGATSAIQKIKTAINSVSSTRGNLGALQNRLDHTINNLGVMTENIQDAESTVRDTDVAEEMMDYTKNNILVQSAQAMLAQANQVPQGVLQLLQ